MPDGGPRDEGEDALLLQRVVQAQHAVQPVEEPAEFDDVLGLDGVVVEAAQEPADPTDLMLDLGVRAADRRGGIGTAQGSRHERDEQLFVGPFVRDQLVLQPLEQGVCGAQVAVAGRQVVGDDTDLGQG